MAASQDLYELLGLTREADADGIRKAYRKLARQFHPDMNGGDPSATEKFKQINQAYEVLSNPEKRARYDRFGQAGVDGAASGAGGDFGAGFGPFADIFDVFFGAGGRAGQEQTPGRGSDLRADLEITLEEVLSGAEKIVTVTRLEHCGECTGSGARTGTRPQNCVVCAGSGYVRTARQTLFGTMSQVTECYRCHGRGKLVTDPCPRCHGQGRERQMARVPVRVPPGVEERTRLLLTDEGEAGPFGGPRGDLYVFIHVRPHRRFRRQGNDLSTEVEVSFARAALGGRVQVPTLEGTEELMLPEGAQSGDVRRLRGKGLPDLNRPQLRGDEHVILRVRTPTNLNDQQRIALKAFAEASGENLEELEPSHHSGGLFEWVRNLFSTRGDEDEPREGQ